MGTRFVNQIREADQQGGIPVENRDFTSRAHYNNAARKCFVLTEGFMTMPFDFKRVLITQVWDVSAGVGSTAVAERDVPPSLGESVTYYSGKEKRAPTPETDKWFDSLMVD
jgi:hypothetical protein